MLPSALKKTLVHFTAQCVRRHSFLRATTGTAAAVKKRSSQKRQVCSRPNNVRLVQVPSCLVTAGDTRPSEASAGLQRWNYSGFINHLTSLLDLLAAGSKSHSCRSRSRTHHIVQLLGDIISVANLYRFLHPTHLLKLPYICLHYPIRLRMKIPNCHNIGKLGEKIPL